MFVRSGLGTAATRKAWEERGQSSSYRGPAESSGGDCRQAFHAARKKENAKQPKSRKIKNPNAENQPLLIPQPNLRRRRVGSRTV